MSTYKPKILIIDDDPIINSVMGSILKDEGYELFFAINGRDGLDKTLSIRPDLIFLDMCMPVLDGVGFLKELNDRGASVCPVLAITGLDDDMVVNECFDHGIFSLVRKPFRSAEIIALCRRYTKMTEIKKRLSFNLETVAFLGKQASSFGLDNMAAEDLIESLPLPLFVKNREQIVTKVNKAFENFTGLNRGGIVGRSCSELSSNRPFIVQSHESEDGLLEEGGVVYHDQMVTDRQGKQREVIIYRSVVHSGIDNHPDGILGVMIDITELGCSSFKKMLVGRYPTLSLREREVANLVRLGMSNKEVAQQLNIALCTVEYHRSNLREKMGLKKGDNINLSTALLSL